MTIKLNLDAKYSQLIDELTILNQKYSAFINGDASNTVQTDAGAIKTLKGLESALQKFKYVQKIVDHRLYSQMIADDANLENGLLVRVWGDTSTVNGLYLKTATATYQKIAYRDIYDLGALLPFPNDNIRIEASEVDTSDVLPLVEFALPTSTVNVTDQVLRGTFKYTSQNVGFKGTIVADFVILVSAGDDTVFSVEVNKTNRIVADLDAALNTVTVEDFTVTHSADALAHNFTVSFVPPKNGSVILPGKLDLQIRGVDTDVVKQV